MYEANNKNKNLALNTVMAKKKNGRSFCVMSVSSKTNVDKNTALVRCWSHDAPEATLAGEREK